MGTASAGISDDRVDISRWNQVDHPAGELCGEVVLPVVRMKRTAARLLGWSENGVTVREQHVGGVAVDIGKYEILHAPGEKRDAFTRRRFAGKAGRRVFVFGNQFV